MNEIRIQKIDGVEFVTYKDYLRLKEEKEELECLGDINEELKEENQKLGKDNQELKGLTLRVDINRRLRKENNKLKKRIAELEKCNINLQRQFDNVLIDSGWKRI